MQLEDKSIKKLKSMVQDDKIPVKEEGEHGTPLEFRRWIVEHCMTIWNTAYVEGYLVGPGVFSKTKSFLEQKNMETV